MFGQCKKTTFGQAEQTRLINTIAEIDEALIADLSATRLLAAMIKDKRATTLYAPRTANMLTIAGVTVACKGGSKELLRKWQNAARKQLAGGRA